MMKGEMIKMTDEMAKKIEVSRHGEETDGWQRKLSYSRAKAIANVAQENYIIPPIVLLKTDGRLLVLDGQHRLEGWKIAKYDLWAYVLSATKAQAVDNFIIMNTRQRRISMKHRLTIDRNPLIGRLRALADKHKVTYSQALAVISGVLGGQWRLYTVRDSGNMHGRKPEEADFRMADNILSIWANDDRWKENAVHDGYRKIGAIFAVAYICGKMPEKYEQTVELLKGINFKKAGTIAKFIGTSGVARKLTVQYMMDYLMKNRPSGARAAIAKEAVHA